MKPSVALLALSLGVAPVALPQEPLRAPKVAVVSLQGVFRDSLLGKGYAAQLEALQKELDARVAEKRAELQKLDAALKSLQDELEKQGAALDEGARDQKQRELARKERERQATFEDGQADLQKARARAGERASALQNEFRAKVRPFIEAVAKEKGIDILLEAQAATIAVPGPDADLTKDVVAKADAAEKAAAKGSAASQGTSPPPSKP